MAARTTTMTGAHAAGIYADMTLDGPVIGTLVAVVDRAKHLPNRKAMGKQDPYCAIRLGKEAKKTETDRRGGQTPKWDQELRFTVHDSLDYNKLKVSVFNDDKKTDLIGETFVDIKDVIVPGGGQNDLWHQLNFKGKYAGEIRMELTYYDNRPREEIKAAKKQARRKTESTVGDNSSVASTPLHVTGPRDISRRPIPTPPVSTPPSVSGPTRQLPEPILSAYRDRASRSEQLNTRPMPEQYDSSPLQHSQWIQQDEGQKLGFADPENYANNSPFSSYQPSSASPDYTKYQEVQSLSQPESRMPLNDNYFADVATHEDVRNEHNFHDSPYPVFRRSPEPRQSLLVDASPPPPQHARSSPLAGGTSRTLGGSKPTMTTPELALQQMRQTNTGINTARNTAYRDSPLRQSITRQDMHDYVGISSDPGSQAGFPPQPPYHRASQPDNRIMAQSYRNSQYDRAPSSSSIGGRSPLQALEQNFSAQKEVKFQHEPSFPEELTIARYSQANPAPPSKSHSPRQYDPTAYQPSVVDADDEYQETVLQTNESFGRFQSRQQSLPTPSQRHTYSDPLIQTIPPRFPRWEAGSLPQTHQQSSTMHDEQAFRTSQPPLYRPQPVTPNGVSMIQRKSITPQSTPTRNSPGLGSIPYSPDSYNISNDNQTPKGGDVEHNAPDGALESARQREVDKLRALGPIIGNDGREIDPSDHLPSDTWAPEPERKNRQPEHVIQIKSRAGARGGRPQPAARTDRPVSGYTSSQVSSRGSSYGPVPTSKHVDFEENQFPKQPPIRPLPRQPFQHHHSSPSGLASNATPPPRRRSYQEYDPNDPPTTEAIRRPPLAEYQIPAQNSYSPTSAAHQQSHVYPRNSPGYQQEFRDQFNVNNYADPLAAELSTIDIGPSTRSGRTAMRPTRAY